MARPLRAVLALALALSAALAVSPGPVSAGDGDGDDAVRGAVENRARRIELLGDRAWPSDGVPGSLLVTVRSDPAADEIVALTGGTRLSTDVVLAHVEPGTDAAVASQLLSRPGVVAVEPDRERQPAMVPNDAQFSEQWSHQMTNVASAWDTTTGEQSVTVAILDTGIDAGHEDLLSNIVRQVDVSSGRVVSRTVGSDNDSCNQGHGTLVAGITGATGNNERGVVGVAWTVGIVDVALTSPASRCRFLDSAMIAGLQYASGSADADIVNMSFGGITDVCPTAVQTAIDDARDSGTLVVAAAGNIEELFPGASSMPASCNGVMSVGAVGHLGDVTAYSQRNKHVDLVAPGGDTAIPDGRGVRTTSAEPGRLYDNPEGTSFASPYVAGAAALLLAVDPTLSPDDLEFFLESTATRSGDRDDERGWGLLNVGAAVAAAATQPAEEPEPDPAFPVGDVPVVERIAPDGTATTPIGQAVATSRATFDPDEAFHAVVARADDFADALAGSALGYGVGPLLFAQPTGPLDPSTRDELVRTLEPGSTVYLLGGTAALPPSLEAEIEAIGLVARRLAGTSRELTAVAVAEALETFLEEEEFERPDIALVATAYNWPDAVTAGSFGALFGMPVLVTAPDSLHPAVAAFLSGRTWDRVYVVGGTAAIRETTRQAVAQAAGLPSSRTERLAGVNRNVTAVAVADELESVMVDSFGFVPFDAYGVNIRNADGFAHVLSASARLGRFSGVFVPIEGENGDQITIEAQHYACRFGYGVVIGASDVIADATLVLFDQILRGEAPACTSR